jgi:hypothetical protein
MEPGPGGGFGRLSSLVSRTCEAWRYLSVAAERSCDGRLLGLAATLASPHWHSECETSRGDDCN